MQGHESTDGQLCARLGSSLMASSRWGCSDRFLMRGEFGGGDSRDLDQTDVYSYCPSVFYLKRDQSSACPPTAETVSGSEQ